MVDITKKHEENIMAWLINGPVKDGEYMIVLANNNLAHNVMAYLKTLPRLNANFKFNMHGLVMTSKIDSKTKSTIWFHKLEGDTEKFKGIVFDGYQFLMDGFAAIWPLVHFANWLETKIRREKPNENPED